MPQVERQPALTVERLTELAEAGAVDTVLVAMCDMQGRLQGKRCHVRYFLDEVLAHATEACNYLLAVDVDMNTVDGYAMSSWERGYGDFAMVPDLATLRRVPWQPGSALLLADLAWLDGSGDVLASPRQVLRRQLDRLAGHGLTAYAGTELEFVLYRDSYEDAWRRGYRDLTPANLYNVDYSLLGTARVEPLLRRIRTDSRLATAAKEIVDTATRTGASVSGPVRGAAHLQTKKKRWRHGRYRPRRKNAVHCRFRD